MRKIDRMSEAMVLSGESHVGYGPVNDPCPDEERPIESRTPTYRRMRGAYPVTSERHQILMTIARGDMYSCEVFQHTASLNGTPVMHVFVFHPEIAWFSLERTSFHYAITYTADGLEMKNRGALPKTVHPLSILLHSHAMDTHNADAFCCFPMESMAAILNGATLSKHVTMFEQEFKGKMGSRFSPRDVPGAPSSSSSAAPRDQCWPTNSITGQPLTVVIAKSQSFKRLWRPVRATRRLSGTGRATRRSA